MNKKCNNIRFIIESSIIGGSLLISSLLGYRIHKLNELDKELTEEYYKKYAETMVETSNWDGVIFFYDGYSYYSTYDESCEATTGECLSECLIDKNIQYVNVNDDFYTIDGRNIYVYIVNNHYVILEADNFKYLNGVVRYIDTHTYDELKDYSVYLDVDKEDSITKDEEVYYKTTRKLIRK